jgi:hypothetical protein
MIFGPLRRIYWISVFVTGMLAAIAVYEATDLMWLAVLAGAMVYGFWIWVRRRIVSRWRFKRNELENWLIKKAPEAVQDQIADLKKEFSTAEPPVAVGDESPASITISESRNPPRLDSR